MKDRVLRDFTPEDIKNIADTFHSWQTEVGLREKTANPTYEDITGFCKSATLDEIKQHDFVLTPGRYVGATDEEDDGEFFADKMARLTAQLKEQFEQSEKLEGEIKKNLVGLGYEV